MTTTTAVREVKHLPPLDKAPIEADARKWVRASIAAFEKSDMAKLEEYANLSRPAKRAKFASELVDAEEAALEAARVKRDAAAYTLHRDYWIRRGAAVHDALGVRRSRWQIIREQQEALIAAHKWTGPVADADQALPEAAAETYMHRARVDAAIAARDTATVELLEKGMKKKDIADLIGRDPSRVSTITRKESAA